jgi:NAD(P)-dependent dehydrogenase (short-subunit alcohol dehydrogenase family)
MTYLSGQVALVTGASRGLGHAAALEFARAGAHVCALARTVGGLEELDDAVTAAGRQATLIPLDIADDDGLARMGAALHQRFGRVDLWLHTAAYAPHLAPAAHIGETELDTALKVNVRAFQRLVRVIEPLLRLAGAPRALVACDDCAGAKFHGLYGATKAAQSAIARSWAAETAGRIAVAEILPPPMRTALRARFFPGEDREALARPAEVARRLSDNLAQGRTEAAIDLR